MNRNDLFQEMIRKMTYTWKETIDGKEIICKHDRSLRNIMALIEYQIDMYNLRKNINVYGMAVQIIAYLDKYNL